MAKRNPHSTSNQVQVQNTRSNPIQVPLHRLLQYPKNRSPNVHMRYTRLADEKTDMISMTGFRRNESWKEYDRALGCPTVRNFYDHSTECIHVSNWLCHDIGESGLNGAFTVMETGVSGERNDGDVRINQPHPV
jgi:hypothetical protein